MTFEVRFTLGTIVAIRTIKHWINSTFVTQMPIEGPLGLVGSEAFFASEN